MWVRRRVNRLNHSREWRWIAKGSGEEAEGGDDHVLIGGRGGVVAPTVVCGGIGWARPPSFCLLSDSFLHNYGSIGMYCLSQRRSWSELGRKPPWAAVPVAASGGGLGRDEAEMEGRERQSLKCVSYTTTGGSTHAHP